MSTTQEQIVVLRCRQGLSIGEIVDSIRGDFEELSDRVWETPELLYQEVRSALLHRQVLEKYGFRIEAPLGGVVTAMTGEFGAGGPVIAILGEFDALPGLSQRAGLDRAEPVEAGGNGHGCGHNLLGAGALLATAAVKIYLAEHGLPGRVRYYGCPAEEGGAAKTFLVRDGYFADCAAALSWHPMAFNGLIPARSLAAASIDFTFVGRSAHAAANPHLGRSALDAVELMSVGVNYMREHIPTDCRVHYAILDAGGRAPNVVQERAVVRYSVRARNLADMAGLVERVRQVADGAALMSETRVSAKVVSAMSDLLCNAPLNYLLHDKLIEVGPPQFDGAERALAARMQATWSEQTTEAAFISAGIAQRPAVLCDWVLPHEADSGQAPGSTDLGDVSWVVPFAQIGMATCAIGTPGHTWQMTSQGKTSAAHKGMVQAAKVLATAAIELINQPETLERVRADFARRTAERPYRSPLPAEAMPGVV
ncbi:MULTISPECIES: amidohydrolase [Ensifer]|uniref:amidohydrolase n=1 Tax=Ensifer TaxID=106591 RepID=UPI0009EAC964|nr:MULTISPECIES: amidohydrolase [Ensifer]MBD9489455.1 amidohydrolase [Ensifer sp. ENS11]MDP9632710.1 aminobenzoyl-glutamate utilization protein B [Ensifer adhaerens]NOV17769.1 amidohydrolase [Ensifer canadensis]